MFHDIFSNKKPPQSNNNLTKVLIDFREKNSLVPSFLSKQNIPFEFTHLEVGDYLIGNTLIERKALSDLEMSIINKRIFDQINQLNSQDHKSLLIIEKESKIESILHPNALRGFFISLSATVPYVFSSNEEETAIYLSLISRKREIASLSRPKRILKTPAEIRQFILEGFPGIGPKKAQSLIEKFGSLKNIFNSSEEELKEILGIRVIDFLKLLE